MKTNTKLDELDGDRAQVSPSDQQIGRTVVIPNDPLTLEAGDVELKVDVPTAIAGGG